MVPCFLLTPSLQTMPYTQLDRANDGKSYYRGYTLTDPPPELLLLRSVAIAIHTDSYRDSSACSWPKSKRIGFFSIRA